MKYLFIIFFVSLFSCSNTSHNLVVDEGLLVNETNLKCTVANSDTTAVVSFNNCWGSITKSGIIIRHDAQLNLSGLYFLAHIQNDSANFDLEVRGLWGKRKFLIKESKLILNRKTYYFGDTVKGLVNLSGQSEETDSLEQKVKFKIEGKFKCVLSDSTFDASSEYENNLILK